MGDLSLYKSHALSIQFITVRPWVSTPMPFPTLSFSLFWKRVLEKGFYLWVFLPFSTCESLFCTSIPKKVALLGPNVFFCLLPTFHLRGGVSVLVNVIFQLLVVSLHWHLFLPHCELSFSNVGPFPIFIYNGHPLVL
jgi:hypothetical protein